VDQVDGLALEVDVAEVQVFALERRQAQLRKKTGCARTGDFHRSRSAELMQFDVIHDDEALEQLDQSRDAFPCRFQQDRIVQHPGGRIALDASLRAQKEVVAALARLQRLNGVGHHAVQPAHPVLAGYANQSHAAQRGPRRRAQQRAQPN
jgi:hypothetical protein